MQEVSTREEQLTKKMTLKVELQGPLLQLFAPPAGNVLFVNHVRSSYHRYQHCCWCFGASLYFQQQTMLVLVL